MTASIPMLEKVPKGFGGSRGRAALLRQELEHRLDKELKVVIDFSGVDVTQSFADELIGVLVFHHGPEVLKRLVFKGCTRDVKAILRFVCSARAKDFAARTPNNSH